MSLYLPLLACLRHSVGLFIKKKRGEKKFSQPPMPDSTLSPSAKSSSVISNYLDYCSYYYIVWYWFKCFNGFKLMLRTKWYQECMNMPALQRRMDETDIRREKSLSRKWQEAKNNVN